MYGRTIGRSTAVDAGRIGREAPAVRIEPAWRAVCVEVDEGTADAVANFLVEHGAAGVLTDDVRAQDGRQRTRLEAHLPEADAGRVAGALERYLDALGELDAGWRAGRVELAAVPAVDWERVFRAHHIPTAIGTRLLVAPPWDVPDTPGREVLVVEPGMAFGTGQHATTRTCLEEIEAIVLAGGVGSALDVGTGSGVLAAALSRLGVPRVAALDVDPAVVPLARTTLARNRAHASLLAGTLAAVRGRFDLVVANILAETLVAEASALAAATAAAGRLVLSGLLADQVRGVLDAFPGWRTAAVRADGAWRTLRLVREAR